MYKYETHLHTKPVSRCACATVRETLEFYKKKGYDGVFITNHFLDGNIAINFDEPYEKKLEFYFSDYEEAVKIGEEIGIKAFLGIELSYGGTDFLIYGLCKEWFYAHPEIMQMKKSAELKFMQDSGAFVVHAHPFREADYIDHIRLYPRQVECVEVINAARTEQENRMAKIYAENYGLLMTAGSDNHWAQRVEHLAGIKTKKPINNVMDYIRYVREGKTEIFTENME